MKLPEVYMGDSQYINDDALSQYICMLMQENTIVWISKETSIYNSYMYAFVVHIDGDLELKQGCSF